ncbi:MAG: glycosyltransferase [Anaerolineae bacterium]|nr:glycosyltransferase [Anaerolineae bacterium]
MTNNRPTITAYCLDWHITTSSAFMELLVKPLAPYADVRLTAWDGQSDLPAPAPDETTIFCQLPPTENWLARYQSLVIWIPMADAIFYPPNMKNHPSVRVVAFSQSVEKMAQDLGLPYLRMQYYVNPDLFTPVSFEQERVLLYWNRTGLFQKRFLLRLCKALRVHRLIFRGILDPRIPLQKGYDLPARVGDMVIETYRELTSHEDYLSLLKRANIFIAPRKVEGVGIAFLEAMASGCCVIAYNEITMNEYIQHGQNGLLFDVVDKHTRWKGRVHEFVYRVLNKLSWEIRRKPTRYPQLTTFQNWRMIAQTDVAQLGANARNSMRDGYARWIANIPAYADFVLRQA